MCAYESGIDFQFVCTYLCASVCFIIQETGTHHSVGSWGIQSRSATFISLKKQTERTYVAVFSILHKIKKDSECARGNGRLAEWGIRCGEDSKGQFYNSLWARGVNRGMHTAERPPDVTQGNPSAARLTKGGMILNWLWKIGSSQAKQMKEIFREQSVLWITVANLILRLFHYLCQGVYVIFSAFPPVVSLYDILKKTTEQISITFGGKSQPLAKELFVISLDLKSDLLTLQHFWAFFQLLCIIRKCLPFTPLFKCMFKCSPY